MKPKIYLFPILFLSAGMGHALGEILVSNMDYVTGSPYASAAMSSDASNQGQRWANLFSVSDPQWTVNSVSFWGAYAPGTPASHNFTIAFYEDFRESSPPIGLNDGLLSTQVGAATVTPTGDTVFGYEIYRFDIDLGSSVELPAGDYMFSVVNMDSTASDYFYWSTTNSGRTASFFYRDSVEEWVPFSDGERTDGFSYQLTGLAMPVQNVTQNSFHATIQAAIDAADAGDTIQVAAGLYDETLVITKPLTLLGAQAGEDARERAYYAAPDPDSESVLRRASNAISIVSIQSDDVTIDGFAFESNPAFTGGSFRIGIMSTGGQDGTNDNFANHVVRNNLFYNIASGIQLFSSVGTTLVEQNAIYNDASVGQSRLNTTPGRHGIIGGGNADGTDRVFTGTIRDNLIVDARNGINGFLENSLIADNEIRGYTGTNNSQAIGGQVRDTTISGNLIKNNLGSGSAEAVGIGLGSNAAYYDNVVITGNTLENNLVQFFEESGKIDVDAQGIFIWSLAWR